MGRKSRITRLPPEVKAAIEQMLAGDALTLDEIIAQMQARWPALAHAGELPSRSGLHRYGDKLERRLAAIKASTEAARLIQQHAGDDKDARSEALTAMVQTELFEAILALQEADDPEADAGERVALLSSAAKNIATLTRSSINLKEFQAKVEAKLIERQRAALTELGERGEIDPATLAKGIGAAYGL